MGARRWTATEDADLWTAVRDGVSEEDIALSIDRTENSVKRRISLLRKELIEVRAEEINAEAALAAKAEKKALDNGPSPYQMWLQAMIRIGRQQTN